MNGSEKNLLGFYSAIGALQSVKCLETREYNAIASSNGYWPQLIYRFGFDNNSEENLGLVIGEIASSECRMLAICNALDFGKLNHDKLRAASVFPIETWDLMEISAPPRTKSTFAINSEIRQLADTTSISEFTRLVNTHMMGIMKIPEPLFGEMAQNQKFEFYGLHIENEMVSGLITFTENSTAGLYFIVTKTSFRGKGLAEFFIGKTLQRLFENGSENVVLQAVNKAVPLYSRIGFVPSGKLFILIKY
jgi:hypothetical protein